MGRILVSGALCLGILIGVASGQNCADDKVRKCIAIAEPMLKDPHLIFPDNMNDINNVCRSWSNFVECIRRYIDKCFSKARKDQFNSAVEPPIASVHQMCSVSTYQAEYLQYAGCIKATVIEAEHCGGHYAVLVSEVSQENVRKANLCCAYHNFRSCVIMKTRLRCDGNQAEGIAARFSRQVLDKAFRFLQDQCLNYVNPDYSPDAGKCGALMRNATAAPPSPPPPPSMSISSRLGEGRSVTLESPGNPTSARKPTQQQPFLDVYRGKASDVYDTVTNTEPAYSTAYDAGRMPSYTTKLDSRITIANSPASSPVTSGPAFSHTQQHQQQQVRQQQQQQSYAVVSGKVNDERPDELSTSRKAEPTHYTPIVENSVPIATATQRPSSYGRGISWTTAQTTQSTSEIPDWATNTWLTHSQDLTTEEIYPAAGSFGGNNIDEPNQQGLSRNGVEAPLPFYRHGIVPCIVVATLALY